MHIAQLLPVNRQAQFIVAIVEDGPPVHGHRGGLVEVLLEMETRDAAKRPAGVLVPLLVLGFAAAGHEAAGAELDPIIVGRGAALKHLLRSQRSDDGGRRRIRNGCRRWRIGRGHRRRVGCRHGRHRAGGCRWRVGLSRRKRGGGQPETEPGGPRPANPFRAMRAS